MIDFIRKNEKSYGHLPAHNVTDESLSASQTTLSTMVPSLVNERLKWERCSCRNRSDLLNECTFYGQNAQNQSPCNIHVYILVLRLMPLNHVSVFLVASS